ncbi:hypothetical protein GX51_01983 [Blastomyces parvus]|uniref:Uncharacterized protein n=1 Tax=Blastomyces parvus TaxID=2060905 RepID=A0A2B7XDH9_9EURO|nr:hypothetical protein GX51_01983 [Blastomyces parvus]
MRTRSQPISPGGFQSLETAPRRRKTQTTDTAPKTTKPTKTTKPAKEASAKVEKKKPGKRGPKKTSKKTEAKSEETTTTAESSNEAPAPAPTDNTSVNESPQDINDIASNQEAVAQPTTDKCEQSIFSSTSSSTVPTPVDARLFSVDTTAPSSISTPQVGSQDEHWHPPSANSLPRISASTPPVRLAPRQHESSILEENSTFSSSVNYHYTSTENHRESNSSAAGQIPATNASSTPILFERTTRHSYPPVSLSDRGPSRPTHRSSTSSLDRSDSQRASRSGNDRFSPSSQLRVSQGQQAGLGLSLSQNSRSSALDVSCIGLENYSTSQSPLQSTAQWSRRPLEPAASAVNPDGARTFDLTTPQQADRAPRSIPQFYSPLHSSPFAPPVEPCQSPLPSTQANGRSSTRQSHSYDSPDSSPFEPFPQGSLYRSGESQLAPRASRTGSGLSGNNFPFTPPPRTTTSIGTQTSPTLASDIVPKCSCCSAILICPNNKHHVNPAFGVEQPKSQRTLTKRTASPRRKRARRRDSSDDDDDLRSSKKRRDAVTSSIARHRQRRVTPYAERSRRRAVESQGRIDKTLFRIPQLIAQNNADRDTTDNDKVDEADVEEPAWDVLNQMRADAAELSDQEQPQTPQPPQTPTRNWDIRGLFNSVPRSISKLIPTFNLSPVRTGSSTEATSTSPEAGRRPALSTPVISSPDQDEPSEQPEQTPELEHLTYSLFPQPLNRRQLLGTPPDVRSPQKRAQKGRVTETTLSKEAANSNTQHGPEDKDYDNNDGSSKNPRKRRRSSPEAIPNPPGTSYGMDLRYFEYSSLSEVDDDSMPANATAFDTEQALVPIPPTEQPAIRGILRGTKRVRFDASPENTPSKLRLRHPQPQTTDDNQGMIEGQGSSLFSTDDPMDISSENSTGEPSTSTPPANPQTPPSESSRDPQPSPPSSPIIRPNPFGTYCLDYDMFSDDDDLYEEEIAAEQATATAVAATSSPSTDITANQAPTTPAQARDIVPSSSQQIPIAEHQPSESRGASQSSSTTPETAPADSQTSQQPSVFANNWTQPPPPRPTPAHASLPTQPITPVGADAVAKLRSQAEKYKPKLPSGLRASRRYSSSPLSAPDSGGNMASQPERFEPLGDSPSPHINTREQRQATEAKGEASMADKENSSDLGGSLERSSYVPNPRMRQLVREMWLEEDDEAADEVFSREFRRFRQERSRLEESELQEAEQGAEDGEEEEDAAHIEPFNLGSYDEFCQSLGEYRRRRAA